MSDDSSSENDAKDGTENDNAVQALINQINQNPYDFSLYQQLAEIQRKNGNLDGMREACERAHSIYCLPVEMWLDWLQIEESLVDISDAEQVSYVLSLYDRAIKDYRYYKVCRHYCKFVLKLFTSGKLPAQQVRDVFEFILQIYALEVNRSGKFWEPYLQFEQNILSTLKDPSKDELSKQIGRIRSIYRRRLILPTSDMLTTWSEYQQWETDQVELGKCQERNLQAQGKIESVVAFEEKFQAAYMEIESNANIERMIALLEGELPKIAGENFNYIMLYFERILSEFTLNSQLWRLYLSYCDDMCKQRDIRISIYEKATKNCENEHDFWIGYLFELEKNEESGEKI